MSVVGSSSSSSSSSSSGSSSSSNSSSSNFIPNTIQTMKNITNGITTRKP